MQKDNQLSSQTFILNYCATNILTTKMHGQRIAACLLTVATDFKERSNILCKMQCSSAGGRWVDTERTLGGRWVDTERTLGGRWVDTERTLGGHWVVSCTIRVTPFPCVPVRSHSFSVIPSCSRYFPFLYYYIPYLSPLLFHISISGSGRDELDQQTELSARSDYILSLYCLCLRIPPCHSVNSTLIVYLHISPLGSSYCPPPYISPHKP